MVYLSPVCSLFPRENCSKEKLISESPCLLENNNENGKICVKLGWGQRTICLKAKNEQQNFWGF